ncbi:MAG: hypothetical protein KH452_04345 [Clostridiales bacterium]|nr:hypothetical protein [Clostridiales bacterium]
MRQYLDHDKKTLEKIVCNQCGRELQLENGIVQEGIFAGEVHWGYFSDRDGERHFFDLCEKCYERLISGFLVPVTMEDETELL